MVVEARAGIDPGCKRVQALLAALQIVREAIAGEERIGRQLANALYALATHLGSFIAEWEECAWLDDYAEMVDEIESIFEG